MDTLIMVTVLMISTGLPISLAVVMVVWQRLVQKRDGRRSPLAGKLAHLPGEQLRRRMDDLSNAIDERVVVLLMIGPMTAMTILLPHVRWAALRLSGLNWATLVAAIGLVLWSLLRLLSLWRERRQCKDGLHAEIAVAQCLDRLQAQDCLVAHDIPAGNFNIDHVVIAPSAVFMVETKSRRKKGDGQASAKVVYDGKSLQFPEWVETAPLEQARAQARWLADYLRAETGDSVPVIPVVCLPGWFVTLGKEAHRGDVRVINPKMTSMFTETGNRPRLEMAHRNRIVNALYKRYPELSAG